MQEEEITAVEKPLNGSELATPEPTTLKPGDRVMIAAELQPRELQGTLVTTRKPGTTGTVLVVRPAELGELRVLVRHDEDQAMAPYTIDELTIIPPVMVKVTRWTTIVLSLPWPGPNDNGFDAPIRAPFQFVKAYPMIKPSMVAGGAPELKLQIVFLTCPDAEASQIMFMLTRPGQTMQVLEDGGEKPALLDIVADPRDGLPIAIWQMNQLDAKPEIPVVEVDAIAGGLNFNAEAKQ